MSRILLVVDDSVLVARSVGRYLKKSFDQVHLAHDSAEALAAAKSATPPVSHVICDVFLGEDEPSGVALVAQLRAAHPSIQRAVLLTGSYLPEGAPFAGVDRIFAKPCDMGVLVEYLLGP